MAIAAVERRKLEPWQDPRAAPYVRIDHVTKKFDDVYAVDDVTLDHNVQRRIIVLDL